MQRFVAFIISFSAVWVATAAMANCPPRSPSTQSGLLLTLRYEGGMRACAKADCSPKLSLNADGRYQVSDGNGGHYSGKLAAKDLGNLQQEINRADFSQIRSRPFTGTCPIAYDGTKTIYTFFPNNRPEQIDTCITAVDPKQPLFQQVDIIMAKSQQSLAAHQAQEEAYQRALTRPSEYYWQELRPKPQ